MIALCRLGRDLERERVAAAARTVNVQPVGAAAEAAVDVDVDDLHMVDADAALLPDLGQPIGQGDKRRDDDRQREPGPMGPVEQPEQEVIAGTDERDVQDEDRRDP